jgi:hypothetical protein
MVTEVNFLARYSFGCHLFSSCCRGENIPKRRPHLFGHHGADKLFCNTMLKKFELYTCILAQISNWWVATFTLRSIPWPLKAVLLPATWRWFPYSSSLSSVVSALNFAFPGLSRRQWTLLPVFVRSRSARWVRRMWCCVQCSDSALQESLALCGQPSFDSSVFFRFFRPEFLAYLKRQVFSFLFISFYFFFFFIFF